MSEQVPTPRRLYRYRSIAREKREQVKGEIVERDAFFSSLATFNDPFEARVRINLQWASPQQWQDLGASIPPDPAALPQWEIDIEKTARDHAAEQGLFCLSEKNDDVLMWSHYADSHAGLCLEFAHTPEFMGGAAKLRYLKEYPTINWLEGDPIQHALLILRSKAQHWEYEQEWRVFRNAGPGMFTYPAGCLTGVILGCEISTDDQREVAAWIEEAEDKIVLYEASRSRSEYAVDIAPISTP